MLALGFQRVIRRVCNGPKEITSMIAICAFAMIIPIASSNPKLIEIPKVGYTATKEFTSHPPNRYIRPNTEPLMKKGNAPYRQVLLPNVQLQGPKVGLSQMQGMIAKTRRFTPKLRQYAPTKDESLVNGSVPYGPAVLPVMQMQSTPTKSIGIEKMQGANNFNRLNTRKSEVKSNITNKFPPTSQQRYGQSLIGVPISTHHNNIFTMKSQSRTLPVHYHQNTGKGGNLFQKPATAQLRKPLVLNAKGTKNPQALRHQNTLPNKYKIHPRGVVPKRIQHNLVPSQGQGNKFRLQANSVPRVVFPAVPRGVRRYPTEGLRHGFVGQRNSFATKNIRFGSTNRLSNVYIPRRSNVIVNNGNQYTKQNRKSVTLINQPRTVYGPNQHVHQPKQPYFHRPKPNFQNNLARLPSRPVSNVSPNVMVGQKCGFVGRTCGPGFYCKQELGSIFGTCMQTEMPNVTPTKDQIPTKSRGIKSDPVKSGMGLNKSKTESDLKNSVENNIANTNNTSTIDPNHMHHFNGLFFHHHPHASEEELMEHFRLNSHMHLAGHSTHMDLAGHSTHSMGPTTNNSGMGQSFYSTQYGMKKLPPPTNNSMCDGTPNYHIEGESYLVTAAKEGCFPMMWNEASDFCQSKSMVIVSLGKTVSEARAKRIMNIPMIHSDSGFWTGGYITHPDNERVPNSIVWTSVSRDAEIVQQGKEHFSNKSKLVGSAGQPDNWEYIRAVESGATKEEAVKEHCVALLLNHIGNDGVKLHDVACYHKLHVVCEKLKMPELLGSKMGISSMQDKP